MENGDLISIIVPVYNVEKYLRDCIRSILAQTYKNIEIILVDDGSTDSSCNICDEYKGLDLRIKVIHKQNGGLSSARNAGLNICKGSYICFVDSDDYIHPEFVSRLYCAVTQQKADFAACSRLLVGEDKKNLEKELLTDSILEGDDVLNISLYWNSAANKIYKSDFISSTRFMINSEPAEDACFMDELSLKANKIVTISQVLYFYRYNPSSILHSSYGIDRAKNIVEARFVHALKVLEIAKKRSVCNDAVTSYFSHLNSFIQRSEFNKSPYKEEAVLQFKRILKMVFKKISIKNLIFALKIQVFIRLNIYILKERVKKVLSFLFWLFSRVKKNRVIVTHFWGSPYEGSIKNLCDELLSNGDIEIIFATSNINYITPEKIQKVRFKSLRYYRLFYTCKVVVSDSRSCPILKKHNQFFIQLWHGAYSGGKKVEADAQNALVKWYVRTAKRDGRFTDLMVSGGKELTKLYHRSFWYKGPVLECGCLDYVSLFNNTLHNQIKDKIYNSLKIDKNKSIILFAPTFRKTYNKDTYNLNFEETLDAFKTKFKKDFVILFHYHRNTPIANHAKVKYDGVKFIDANKYDIYDLEISSDFGIGDYSCFNLEMALLGKPVFRYANDLADFNNDRNSYIPFKDLPFPYAFDMSGLISIIKNFDYDEYKDKCGSYLSFLGTVKNKDAAHDVASFINEVIRLRTKKKIYNAYKNRLIWPQKLKN